MNLISITRNPVNPRYRFVNHFESFRGWINQSLPDFPVDLCEVATMENHTVIYYRQKWRKPARFLFRFSLFLWFDQRNFILSIEQVEVYHHLTWGWIWDLCTLFKLIFDPIILNFIASIKQVASKLVIDRPMDADAIYWVLYRFPVHLREVIKMEGWYIYSYGAHRGRRIAKRMIWMTHCIKIKAAVVSGYD